MNIVVLAGSPKGELSITLQYVRFLEKKYPQHTFSYHHVARDLRKLEQDPQQFDAVIERIKAADLIVWSFPLYYLLVHGHYKRFIELIWERQATAAFAGKYALAIATSIHFYDHTALYYIRAVSEDLGMHFIDGFSADMQDLLDAEQRRQLLLFFDNAVQTVEQQQPTFRLAQPGAAHSPAYQPGPAPATVDAGEKKVLIVCDLEEPEGNQAQMVARLQACFGGKAETVNLRELRIDTSCLGCIRCGYDNCCPLEDRDDFIPFYRERVMVADILIYAGDIRDRYLSARWKTFFDRTFFLGHTPSIMGKQLGIVIAGPLSSNPHLREILEAYCERMEANLVAMVSDECDDAAVLDAQLELLARRLVACSAQDYRKPQTFLGIAGNKLMRDAIWGRLRFPFVADHRYYKAHGYYDFPYHNWRMRLRNGLMMMLVKNPRMRKEVYQRRMKHEMVKAMQKIAESA
ncbi:MAG: NAD(P)H-dependent oxidoreductase [Syntrophotaleaceae bacterium]